MTQAPDGKVKRDSQSVNCRRQDACGTSGSHLQCSLDGWGAFNPGLSARLFKFPRIPKGIRGLVVAACGGI